MERILLSELEKATDGEISGDFHTSGISKYMVTSERTGEEKIGYYKHVENDLKRLPNEYDIREFLCSKVLEKAGFECAEVLLAKNDLNEENEVNSNIKIIQMYHANGYNPNGCISVNVLNNNERFIKMPPINAHNPKEYINEDLMNVSDILGDISKEEKERILEQRKKFLIENIFLSALVSNSDVRPDNMMLVQNQETGEFKNPPYFDMGLAFIEAPHKEFFYGMNAIQVLDYMYQRYPSESVRIGKKIQDALEKDTLKTLISEYGLESEVDTQFWGEANGRLNERLEEIELLNARFKGFDRETIQNAIQVVDPTKPRWKQAIDRAVNFIREKTIDVREKLNDFLDR